MRPLGGRVHPGSLSCALVVVGIIQDRWVHWDVPWGSLGSSGVAAFIGVRPIGRWIHPGSFGSLGCSLGVVRFIRVHWGARLGSSSSSGVPGLIGVRGLGFVWFILVHSCAQWGS